MTSTTPTGVRSDEQRPDGDERRPAPEDHELGEAAASRAAGPRERLAERAQAGAARNRARRPLRAHGEQHRARPVRTTSTIGTFEFACIGVTSRLSVVGSRRASAVATPGVNSSDRSAESCSASTATMRGVGAGAGVAQARVEVVEHALVRALARRR